MKARKQEPELNDNWNQLSIFDGPITTEPQELSVTASQNHILCRKNVIYCEKVRTQFNSAKYKFDNTCEITGQQWESEVWSSTRDYEKNPTPPSPCKSCELAKCEWCVFNGKNKPEYLFGCCGSCAYKETCPESEWKKKQGK